jgi:hypothetical protein
VCIADIYGHRGLLFIVILAKTGKNVLISDILHMYENKEYELGRHFNEIGRIGLRIA